MLRHGAGAAVLVLAGLAAAPLVAQQGAQPPAGPPQLQTVLQKVSYGVGRSIGGGLAGDGFRDLDLQLVFRGISDAMAGRPDPQKQEEFAEAVTQYQQSVLERRIAQNKEFMAQNARQPGVQTTASGLQYQVLRAGTGAKPTANSRVKAHYQGTFLDGRTFDSSYERMEPAVFPLNGVIRGWTEGVPLMQTGAKFKFWIPPELGYGAQGRPGIPPNSLLVFEVELLEVLPAEPGLPGPPGR